MTVYNVESYCDHCEKNTWHTVYQGFVSAFYTCYQCGEPSIHQLLGDN